MAPTRVGERTLGIEALEHLEALVRHDLADRYPLGRRASHGDRSVFDHQVGGVRLQHVARALEQSLAQRGCRLGGGVAHLDRAPAARRERRLGDVLGVRGRHRDLLERPAQPVGRDLRGHRLMPLALRRRTDVQLGRPVLVDPQLRRLAAPKASRFDAAGDPQADGSSILGGLGDGADLLERDLQQPRIVAAVVDEAAAPGRIPGRERDLLGLDQVSAPQLGRRDVQGSRQLVHRALDRVVAERPTAAADETARHRVGEDDLRLHLHRRHHVRRQHVRDDDVGLAGA